MLRPDAFSISNDKMPVQFIALAGLSVMLVAVLLFEESLDLTLNGCQVFQPQEDDGIADVRDLIEVA